MEKKSVFISIQDHTGDRKLKINWDPKDKAATKNIEKMFVDLQDNGYRFFSVKKVMGLFEKKGKLVSKYDPKLGELIYEKNDITGESIAGRADEVSKDPEKEEAKNKLTANKSSKGFEMEEVEKETGRKYVEPKKYNPSKEKFDDKRDYVATKPMRAG